MDNVVTYRQLNNDGKVYALIDTVNVVFENTTLASILRWLKINNGIDELLDSVYDSSRGFVDLTVLSHNGIRFEIYDALNALLLDDRTVLLDITFPKIRVDISGTGHDFLRSLGIDFASYRYVVPCLPEGASYHYTRFDFAYDFVNYKPEFMSELIDHITKYQLPGGRVPLCSYEKRQGSAVSASIRTVSQRTVYLGSPQSDRMLRIYDKALEQKDKRTGVYRCHNPYGDPDSWFRIELQMRREVANSLAISCSDLTVNSFESVLKDIMQRYSFADPSHNVNISNRPPVAFWDRLFDWNDIKDRLIILNEKRVEKYTPEASLFVKFNKMVRMVIEFITQFGIDELDNACSSYVDSLYDLSSSSSLRRRNALISSIGQLPCASSIIDTDNVGLSIRHGRFSWNKITGGNT